MKKFSSRSLVAAATAVVVLALAGCSDSADPDTNPTKEPTAGGTNTPADPSETDKDGEEPTNTPVPTIEPGADGDFEWCDPADQKPFTGEAATKFGAEKVMDAYCTLVQMQMDYSYDSGLWRKTEGFTAQEFSPVRDSLTQTARKDWDALVAQVVAGTAPGDTGVNGLMTADFIGGSGYTLDEPAVFNQRFSAAQSWVDTANPSRPRLGLKFSVGADVALVRNSDQKEMAYPWDKTITYWLTPGRKGGEKAWYIDGFSFEVADAEPVKREALIKGEVVSD